MIWCIIFEFTIEENENGDPYIYSISDWSEGVKKPLMFYTFSIVMTVVFTWIAACSKNLILRRAKRDMAGLEDIDRTQLALRFGGPGGQIQHQFELGKSTSSMSPSSQRIVEIQ